MVRDPEKEKRKKRDYYYRNRDKAFKKRYPDMADELINKLIDINDQMEDIRDKYRKNNEFKRMAEYNKLARQKLEIIAQSKSPK